MSKARHGNYNGNGQGNEERPFDFAQGRLSTAPLAMRL